MTNSDRPVRPWDMLNKNMEKVMPIIKEQRLEICRVCPEFIKFTHQCKKCGCLMDAKTKLAAASCPLGKWGKFEKKIPLTYEITQEELDKIESENL